MKTNQPQDMLELSIHQMQQTMNVLLEKIDQIGSTIANVLPCTEIKEDTMWLNVEDLQRYIPSHPRKQTIYSWTSTRKIPFHKKGRSIMFDKKEIDEWLQDSSHIKSENELEREAHDFVMKKKQNNI